jgi:hypothetical protein
MTAIPKRLAAGMAMLAAGQTLIIGHWLPASYYYFPLVWYGYILAVDGGLEAYGRASPWTASPRNFGLLIPVSAGFWWLFEAFDQVGHNWRYVGGGAFPGVGFALLATLCFSTVLLAIWETAFVVSSVMGRFAGQEEKGDGIERLFVSAGRSDDSAHFDSLGRGPSGREFGRDADSSIALSNRLLVGAFAAGIGCVMLPVLFPQYAYGLIWVSLFLFLDPINAWMGQRSLIADLYAGRFRTAATFAVAALGCGVSWEFWNYWAVVHWVYTVPYTGPIHLFAMPLPGYLGYLPFGLEAFAATVFTLSLANRAAATFSHAKRAA